MTRNDAISNAITTFVVVATIYLIFLGYSALGPDRATVNCQTVHGNLIDHTYEYWGGRFYDMDSGNRVSVPETCQVEYWRSDE